MKTELKCVSVTLLSLILSVIVLVGIASAAGYGSSYSSSYSSGYGSGYYAGSYQKYSPTSYGGDTYACYNACIGGGSYLPNQCRQWCQYNPSGAGYYSSGASY